MDNFREKMALRLQDSKKSQGDPYRE
ncbi:hypothetical protein CCACVL1_06190 [Corchorus capsularis]|uniref:Uncharacterized protein n=1 Tax=Corchorus capsularis TaxID=210143 RepID=A0A1R3JGY3_COCAP|nr:hypothetical protein CCACVL1_06190 [Corchorus capsularis]